MLNVDVQYHNGKWKEYLVTMRYKRNDENGPNIRSDVLTAKKWSQESKSRSLQHFVEENGYRLHVTTHSNPSAPNCLSRFTLLRFGERLEGNILSALQRDTHHLFSTEQTYSPKDIDMSSRGFGRGGGRSPGGRSPGGRGRGGFGGRGGDGGGRFGRDEGPPAEIVGA